jgi:protein phosphatase PTC1
MLVDHALNRFSTDNLSVMIVRFDPQKLQTNTKLDIGVETGANKDKSAISEVEMIVGAARRSSGIVEEGVASDQDSEELMQSVIQEEDQEPGPELTPEGKTQADRILDEKQATSEKTQG